MVRLVLRFHGIHRQGLNSREIESIELTQPFLERRELVEQVAELDIGVGKALERLDAETQRLRDGNGRRDDG